MTDTQAHIRIYDRLFSSDDIIELENTIHSKGFSVNAASSNLTIGYTEVMSEMNKELSLKSRAGSVCLEAAKNSFSWLHECEFDQVLINFSKFGDYTFSHVDVDSDDYVSILLYANSVWRPEWGGETVFFAPGGEATVSVIPVPGRIVVYKSNTLHLAGVPNRLAGVPRLSVSYRLRRQSAQRAEAEKTGSHIQVR